MTLCILRRLSTQVDDFLSRWTASMKKVGYLAFATAKRDDFILSYRLFLEPLLRALEQGRTPSFGELTANTGNWADGIIQTSRRHRSRGVTGDMFIGCLKTLVRSILEMIDEGDDPPQQKAAAVKFVRLWSDALETIIVRDWTTMSDQKAADSLDRANRLLTMEKCKYQNVLDSISDFVFLLNVKGLVMEANRSARQYFMKDPTGFPIWELLGLAARSMTEVLSYCPRNTPREISLDGVQYFHCIFVPLNEVCLSPDGYLAILRDVSAHVKQRELLEAAVAERTAALVEEKAKLQDMNVTLRVVMQSVDEDREAFEQSVARIVHSTLLPTLDTVRRERSESIRNSYLDILEDQLLKLNTRGEQDRRALLLKLTPTEMKICQFIRAGASTKDIAESLNLSRVTIQTHRRNIRCKMELQNRKMNLYTFLNNAD
jgi:DNA-binding NarL/FixJ family response regulator